MKFEGIPMHHHGYPLWQYSHLCTSHTDPRMLVIFYLIRQAKVARQPNFYSSFQPMSTVREWSSRAFRCVTMDNHYGSTAILVHLIWTPARVLVNFDFIRQAKVAGPPNFFQPMSTVREWSLRAFRCVTMDTQYGSTAVICNGKLYQYNT